ncbi:MAG TPA: hypothetical protein PLM75_02285 [bacterium]|nr:hypothetical protein [bacterium]
MICVFAQLRKYANQINKKMSDNQYSFIKNILLYFIIFLIFIIFFILRLVYLDADPSYISWSFGAFTDIGYYAANARNSILFNNPIIGDWDNRLLFPTYHYLMLIWFKLTSVSFASINLFAVIISFGTMIILMLLKKNIYYRIFIAFLYSVNFLAITTNRIAYLENFSVFFLAAALLFITRGGIMNTIFALFFAILAIFTKSTSAFFLGICVFYWLYLILKKQLPLKKFFSYLIFLLCAFIIIYYYYSFAIANYNNAILNYTIFNKSANNFSNFYLQIFNGLNTNFFARFPIISLTAFLYVIYLILKKKCGNTDFFACLWILTIFLQFIFFRYNPLRYYLYFLPPFIIFSAKFFANFNEISEYYSKSISIINLILIAPFIFFSSYNISWVYFRSFKNQHIHFSNLINYTIIIFCIFTLLFTIYAKLLNNSVFKKFMFYTFIVLFVLESAAQLYLYHYKNITFDLKNISTDIQTKLKSNHTLAGWFAPQIGLNTKIKTLPSYNMNTDYLKANNVTHLLLQSESIENTFNDFNLQYLENYYIHKIKAKLFLYEKKW